MKKVTLPSGKILEIDLAPFSLANDLNKAVACEMVGVKVNKDLDLLDPDFIKTVFCKAYSSDRIMNCVHECMKRCTYDGKRIVNVEEVFESEQARADYLPACKEVLIENISPFAKALLSQFKDS